MLKILRKGQVDTCIIEQHSEIEFEYYSNKKAETTTHPIHSCTKSVISMLIGICIKDGLISDINTPIREYFPDHMARQEDKRKEAVTIYHLLTMTPGFDWPEFGIWNFGSPMEYSRDMIGFIIDRDLETASGTKMTYNSGCSNLLSAIIQSVSGMKIIDFAYKHLFMPLGIKDILWHEKQGINLGANGLRMKPADLLRLGNLYLRRGEYGGTQIVPREWVDESTQPAFFTYPDIGHYGYHWWVSDLELEGEEKTPYYFAMGLFGQFIIVVPKYETVVVFMSKNYSDTMQPMQYFRDIIAPLISPR